MASQGESSSFIDGGVPFANGSVQSAFTAAAQKGVRSLEKRGVAHCHEVEKVKCMALRGALGRACRHCDKVCHHLRA